MFTRVITRSLTGRRQRSRGPLV